MRIFALLALAVALPAQPAFEFWPGTVYDPAVPSFQKVLGFEPGSRLATHEEMGRYFDTLAAFAPGRVKVVEYGKSWEGRRLIYAVIGSEANLRRLPEIQAAMKKLNDARKTGEAEAKKLIASTPAIVWLGHAVHGNEVSGPDSALLAAYHLLAARNQPAVDNILKNTLVLIDPLQNPDGRMRFVHAFEQNVGLEPDASPAAAERNEPWPGGRMNHYLFDMNRDWFAATQPETKARIRMFLEWLPPVVVDLHEMGSESSYYFAPEAVPFNPHLTKEQKTSLDWFGRNNAKYFDQLGYTYFTREVYDAFYPGYGASWPAYYGGIAMTYENSSVRGLAYRRADGSMYTFKDSVRKHFTTQIATCEAAANYREQLLVNFWNYAKSAIEEGKNDPVKGYILPRRGDVAAVDKLARLLVEQGIEVGRAPASVNGYPDGSYVVSTAQPLKRLIRVLLDKDVTMEPEFLKEQERRRAKKLGDEIYDVTAWSLPLMYNVEAVAVNAPVTARLEPFAPAAPKPAAIGQASVAYLVPWRGRAAAKFLAASLRADLKVRSSDKEFAQEGRTYPRGTLILLVRENPASVHETVKAIAGEAEVVPVQTGWVDSGVNFGSGNVKLMKKPRIAIAWDRPVSAYSAGAARFVIEREFGYPASVIRTATLASADLDLFDVLILPAAGFSGSYADSLGGSAARLRAWVQKGGTIIGIEEAAGFLASANTGLLSTAAESLAVEKKADAPKPDNGRVPGRVLNDEAALLEAIRPERESNDAVQGVLAIAKTDPDHWITAGVPSTVHALVQGRTIYSPLRLDRGVNAAYFTSASQLLASGYMWEENRRQLAFKPLLMVERQGAGHVIGFAYDPNYRAYLDGMNVLFLNAIFRGPAHSR